MILADTGFFIALLSPRDRLHQVARTALLRIDEPLITTYPVITETCYLLLREAGSHIPPQFLNSFVDNPDLSVFDLQVEHFQRLAALMDRYADLPMDLADASLVVAAEQLEEGRILTSDRRDFTIYRWQENRPFLNLMLMF